MSKLLLSDKKNPKSQNIGNLQTLNRRKLQEKLNDDMINELKEAFNLFDNQKTGEIDAQELKAIMRAFGIDVNKGDILSLMNSLGKNINETINFNEFLNVMSPRLVLILIQGNRGSKEEIDKIFKLFDEESTGKISFKTLKKIALDIGENISEEELFEMFEEADRDNDGYINNQDFYRIMRRRDDPFDDSDDEN